ncbi:hypothetical protein A5791_04550, partial [Mycobacterium sp. 852002-51163_SCH5372311]|uniref:hypothetical protein n=1 Tax=Mycobacterium sp. 852002-51163_SCH5372311 TaxID=1834097 RepID=UPI0007FBFAC0
SITRLRHAGTDDQGPDSYTTLLDATRRVRPFPGLSFKESLFLAEAIQEHGAGKRIRRLTLFQKLNRSPTSGTSRTLITSSSQYGLTTGAYNAEFLDLTPEGRTASDKSISTATRLQAQINLAILNLDTFKQVFEKYAGNRLPPIEVLRDAFKDAGIEDDLVQEAAEIFLANTRELGLVRQIAGSEHLVSVDTVLDEAHGQAGGAAEDDDESESESEDTPSAEAETAEKRSKPTKTRSSGSGSDLDDVCFIVSPIGDANSLFRKHANLVLTSLIEPALADLGLRAVRADKISKPGLITGQVIEHIAKARLVIADLSFANPNVYYELALRHAARKPVVQIIRSEDALPFDVGQYRTVTLDMTDIYTLVPQLELHRQEITRQCRAALNEGVPSLTQLSLFYPEFWDHVGK